MTKFVVINSVQRYKKNVKYTNIYKYFYK